MKPQTSPLTLGLQSSFMQSSWVKKFDAGQRNPYPEQQVKDPARICIKSTEPEGFGPPGAPVLSQEVWKGCAPHRAAPQYALHCQQGCAPQEEGTGTQGHQPTATGSRARTASLGSG